MNIIGICAYISRKADYCSSLLGALSELCQEVVGHMMPRKDIKRMVLILWSREGGAQGLVYQRMGAEVQHLRLQVFESRDGPDRGERRELWVRRACGSWMCQQCVLQSQCLGWLWLKLESRICASASVLEEQVWRGESMAISFPHALCRDCWLKGPPSRHLGIVVWLLRGKFDTGEVHGFLCWLQSKSVSFCSNESWWEHIVSLRFWSRISHWAPVKLQVTFLRASACHFFKAACQILPQLQSNWEAAAHSSRGSLKCCQP